MVALVGIGHSHLHCVTRAYEARRAVLPGLRYVQMCLLDPPYARNPEPVYAQELADLLKTEPQVCVFMFCAGSEHVRFGLINQPRPFDFIAPDRPDDPLVADEVVPYDMMRDLTRPGIVTKIIADIRQAAPLPLVQLSPPPPIRDAAFIRGKVTDAAMAADLARWGVAPAAFRARVWRVCMATLREVCEANDVAFLPAPAAAVDDDFCLAERFASDFVHANAGYGDLLLDQLLARVAVAFPDAKLAGPHQ